jgi:haloalkane dehalogenase
MRTFSLAMGSPPMQALIKRTNFFVTTLMKRMLQTEISDSEFAHYTDVVPTLESRQGIAEFPRQIRASGPWLTELEQRAKDTLTDRPIVLVRGQKDPAFGGDRALERWSSTFPDHSLVLLPEAGHYIQEDAPEPIVDAIIDRFGTADDY